VVPKVIVLATCITSSPFAFAKDLSDQEVHKDRVQIELEAGVAYQTRNTASRPGDVTDRFSYRDLVGSGPFGFGRITAITNPDDRAGYRFVIAPFSLQGIGTLDHPIRFSGKNFAAGTTTKGGYTFNVFRFGWWNRWRKDDRNLIRAGWTVNFRDASVSLSQNGTNASYSNFGPVPLFHIDAEHQLGNGWSAFGEVDGLIGPGGGLEDVALHLAYSINQKTKLYAGVRYLDGGSDQNDGYYFSTFWFFSGGLSIRL
jgi:hypothetical protein